MIHRATCINWTKSASRIPTELWAFPFNCTYKNSTVVSSQSFVLGGRGHNFLVKMKLLSPFGGCLALLLFSLFNVCTAEGGEEEAVNVLLFMFFGIGVGVIFMQCLNYIGDPVPYTVVVFIAGILFSLSNKDGTGRHRDYLPLLLTWTFLMVLLFFSVQACLASRWRSGSTSIPNSYFSCFYPLLSLVRPWVLTGITPKELFFRLPSLPDQV